MNRLLTTALVTVLAVLVACPSPTPPPSNSDLPAPTNVTVVPEDRAAVVFWQAEDDARIAGFNVYRDGAKLNPAPITAPLSSQGVSGLSSSSQALKPQGGTGGIRVYKFKDSGLENARKFKFKIVAIGKEGKEGTPSEESPATPLVCDRMLVQGTDMGAKFQNIRVSRGGSDLPGASVRVNGTIISLNGATSLYQGELPFPVAVGNGEFLRVQQGDCSLAAYDWVPEAPIVTAPAAGANLNPSSSISLTWTSATNPDRFVVSASWLLSPTSGTGWTSSDLPGAARTFSIPADTLPAGTTIKLRVYAYNDGAETFAGAFETGSRMAIRNGDEAGHDVTTTGGPCAITGLTPVPNTHTAPRDSTIKAQFCDTMNAPSDRDFVIQAFQTGQRLSGSGTFGGGSTSILRFDVLPAALFKPGEEIEVSYTDRLTTTSGRSVAPTVYRFRAGSSAANHATGFNPRDTYSVTHESERLVAGDFTGDGLVDIAVALYGEVRKDGTRDNSIGQIAVLPNKGGVGFTDTVYTDIENGPAFLAAGDFNHDGRLDLVASSNNNRVRILLNDGTGRFTPRDHDTGRTVGPVAVADMNRDGLLDVVFGTPTGVAVNLGDGTGGFSGGSVSLAAAVQDILVGDFNGDHAMDVLTTNPAAGSVSILLNNGSGRLGLPADYPMPNQPNYGTVGDFNGDGRLDAVIVNFEYGPGDVSLLLGDGTGHFAPRVPLAVATQPYTVSSADYDGDDKLDLAVVTAYESGVQILYGDGAGGFTAAPLTGRPTGTTGYIQGITTADFNGDGRMDLATTNTSTFALTSNVDVLIKNP